MKTADEFALDHIGAYDGPAPVTWRELAGWIRERDDAHRALTATGPAPAKSTTSVCSFCERRAVCVSSEHASICAGCCEFAKDLHAEEGRGAATGPGSRAGAGAACCEKGAKLVQDWVYRYRCPDHGRQNLPRAAPQTDHRAAPDLVQTACGPVHRDNIGTATPPSGSPPAVAEPGRVCNTGKHPDGCCPSCDHGYSGIDCNCLPGRAAAPGEPVTSGSPPGAAEACNCANVDADECPTHGVLTRWPDGSRGTR